MAHSVYILDRPYLRVNCSYVRFSAGLRLWRPYGALR